MTNANIGLELWNKNIKDSIKEFEERQKDELKE